MADMKVAKKTIRELSKLLGEHNLTEIEMEQDGVRIRVSRASTAAAPCPPAPAEPDTTLAKPAKYDPCTHPGCVKSPMVGTVYVAAEPGAEPLVKAGDKVKKGQTLLIVEAMKVMNPITAHVDGKIKEILINDAQPVEYGEPLLVIE